jgi:hypothetical protein
VEVEAVLEGNGAVVNGFDRSDDSPLLVFGPPFSATPPVVAFFLFFFPIRSFRYRTMWPCNTSNAFCAPISSSAFSCSDAREENIAGERTRVLLCNTIGGGSAVLLEGWVDATGPITIGKQTEGGRAANGETEEGDVTVGTSVNNGGPLPDGGETIPGVELFVGLLPADDIGPVLDPEDTAELRVVNDAAVEVASIRDESTGSDFVACAVTPGCTALGTVVKSCPGDACVLQSDADLPGKASGVDVSGGGSGPTPLFTLRLRGGSSGTVLSFFLELLLPPSLPLTGSAEDDADCDGA